MIKLLYLYLIGVSVELAPFNLPIPGLKKVLLKFEIVQKLTQSLNLCCLKEADDFEVVAHESPFIPRNFGYHGSKVIGGITF